MQRIKQSTPQPPAAATDALARTCGHSIGMWDDERARPWRAFAIYGLALLCALLASHLWPWGFAS